MMLKLIEARAGVEIARAVADQFILERMRDGAEHSRLSLFAPFAGAHPILESAIALMENNVEEPLSMVELARSLNISDRQLQRIFQRCLGVTPVHYYLTLRLRRAQALLAQTNLSATHIAVACGFRSTSHFSHSYRDMFGTAPLRYRASRIRPNASN
jgi:transcriptional regulator GlxA family with amidase domain